MFYLFGLILGVSFAGKISKPMGFVFSKKNTDFSIKSMASYHLPKGEVYHKNYPKNTKIAKRNEQRQQNPGTTFQYTGWLIGILILAYYNPHITG